MYATREPDYQPMSVRTPRVRPGEEAGSSARNPRSPVRQVRGSVRVQGRLGARHGAQPKIQTGDQPNRRAKPRTQLQQKARGPKAQNKSQSKAQRQVTELAQEALLKLSVNTLLMGVSAIALVHLVPAHLTQRNQLREVRSELTFTQTRVDKLRADFSRTFDPMQAQSVMQQQTHLIDPSERPVFFTPKIATLEDSQP